MNLLLEQDKQDIKKGLKNRFIIVLLGAISCAFIIGIILLLPAYFISDSKLSTSEVNKNLDNNTEANSADKSLDIPNEISAKIDLISLNTDRKNKTDYITEIIKTLPENISIDSIAFLDDQTFQGIKGLQIDVSGISSDRDTLLDFVKSLKESANFSSVFVPVSDFTKNKDVTFNINIFVNQK